MINMCSNFTTIETEIRLIKKQIFPLTVQKPIGKCKRHIENFKKITERPKLFSSDGKLTELTCLLVHNYK